MDRYVIVARLKPGIASERRSFSPNTHCTKASGPSTEKQSSWRTPRSCSSSRARTRTSRSKRSSTTRARPKSATGYRSSMDRCIGRRRRTSGKRRRLQGLPNLEVALFHESTIEESSGAGGSGARLFDFGTSQAKPHLALVGADPLHRGSRNDVMCLVEVTDEADDEIALTGCIARPGDLSGSPSRASTRKPLMLSSGLSSPAGNDQRPCLCGSCSLIFPAGAASLSQGGYADERT